jgi:hypothetical protein
MATARLLVALAAASVLLVAPASGAVPVTASMRVFGHSIKNGHFPSRGTEITTFEHNCSAPPCAITQMHCPTAGPVGWQDARVRVYVDGEAVPSIDITLLELANIGVYNGQDGDAAPWGVGLFGHTANKGGVYSTVRIPFGASVRTTIESAQADRGGTFWFIVRGLEAYPVVLGDLALPPAARLRLHRFDAPTLPNELVTLASVPRGVGGAVLATKFDAAGHGKQANMGYLEACMRATFDGADPSAPPVFLSSGAEDYFLSAYYFNEGVFKTPQAGLTYKAAGAVSAYKVHDRDPILFADGLNLTFRNGEVTGGCGTMEKAPNQWCPPNATATATTATAAAAAAAAAAVNMTEYVLGPQGATCDGACQALQRFCAPDISAATAAMDADDGAAMMAHLGISDCLKNSSHGGLKWWAPDQPNYVSGDSSTHSNYHDCLGFVGAPPTAQCSAEFATARRVCRCVDEPPPTPAPSPDGADYHTLIWIYEWPKGSAPANANVNANAAPAPSASERALALVGRLGGGKAGLLRREEEDALVDAVLAGDVRLTQLAAAVGGDGWSPERAARQLRRALAASREQEE